MRKKCHFSNMDFRTRLREQIEFLGMRDKEVAAKAGITKRAIDCYVGSRACMPAADVAVRIAQVLGVSVEYLVTGVNSSTSQSEQDSEIENQIHLYRKYNSLIKNMEILSPQKQKLVTDLAKGLVQVE